MLDLPDPFGPEITVNPSRSGIFVVPPKDLNRESSTRLMCTIGISSVEVNRVVTQSVRSEHIADQRSMGNSQMAQRMGKKT